MIDYLGNEIHIGDTVLYSPKGCKGYMACFNEGIVTEKSNEKKNIIKIDNDCRGRLSENVINLTALGLREQGNVRNMRWLGLVYRG